MLFEKIMSEIQDYAESPFYMNVESPPSYQKPYGVYISTLSIIIMVTVNNLEKMETNKMDWNPPITVDRRDLLSQLM